MLQTLNNNESIGIQVYSPNIDSDVAAVAIKISNLEIMLRFKYRSNMLIMPVGGDQ